MAMLALILAVASASFEPMVRVDPAACNLARAARVELETLLDYPDPWIGRCVAVRGLWSGRALYLDMRDAQRRGAEGRDESRGRRIGIYASDALVRLRRSSPRMFRAVGVLIDCQALWEGQYFVSGYCHNNVSGPLLAVTQMRLAD